MSIVSITTDVPGQIGDEPRRLKIISTDNLATVTAAGYLNSGNLLGYTINPTDIIDMYYGYNPPATVGTYNVFLPSFSNGVITLAVSADVLPPSVNSAVLTTTSAGVPTWKGPLTNGQLVVGSTGASPVAATLTGGTGISVSNGAGSITIASTTTLPLTVPNGGTGLSTTTAYGLLAGGTTATGNFQNAGTGTSGQMYVSGGASALGTWTTPTGTGVPVNSTSPTLVTPTLGAATATSITFGGSVLSTYVTGTWTPALAGSSANPTSVTYSFQVGEYTRIGNVVYYYGRLILTALTIGAASGQLQITGLPVASVNTTALDSVGSALVQNCTIDASTLFIVGRVAHGQTYLNILENANSSAASTTMAITNISSTTDITVSGFYFTS